MYSDYDKYIVDCKSKACYDKYVSDVKNSASDYDELLKYFNYDGRNKWYVYTTYDENSKSVPRSYKDGRIITHSNIYCKYIIKGNPTTVRAYTAHKRHSYEWCKRCGEVLLEE